MGVEAVDFYRAKYRDDYNIEDRESFITDNFIKEDETFIPAQKFVKDHSNIRRVGLKELINSVSNYIKSEYKERGFSKEETTAAVNQARVNLIKQTFFSRFVANNSESDDKWGVIQSKDGKIRLAPMFAYDACAGAEVRRPSSVISASKSRMELLSFIQDYSKELWFREWLSSKVQNINMKRVFSLAKSRKGLELSNEQKDYYEFLINLSQERVKDAVEANFNPEVLAELNKEKMKNRVKRTTTRVVDNLNTVKNFVSPDSKDDGR